MKILVAGGAGFLGSHLCDRLLAEDHEVIAFDSFFTGRKANLEAVREHSGFKLVQHDVTEPFNFEVDRIFNLACPASPPHLPTRSDPHGEDLVSRGPELSGTCPAHGRTGVSSQHVRGLRRSRRASAAGKLLGQRYLRSCYDEGKRVAETLFMDYHRRYGLEVRLVRISNTYGPRMHPRDGRVVSNFIVQVLQGEDLTIYGDGTQTRSFCYVADLIEGFCSLMDQDVVTGPINVGNPGEFTMRQLADKVLRLTGSKSRIVFRPLPADDPKQRRPDITLARQHLGWEPRVPLAEGLQRTIEYFRTQL